MPDILVSRLPYTVGALMYTPAVNSTVAERLCNGAFPGLSSLVFCFEDSLLAASVEGAEAAFLSSLRCIDRIKESRPPQTDKLPLLFVRVRSPAHLLHIRTLMQPYRHLVSGFVLPKYDMRNAREYERAVLQINTLDKQFYVMPTLETESIIYKEKRCETLAALKDAVDAVSPYILNVRVGGNDFCRIFGLRRSVTQTIYDISLVNDVLTDILNIFGRDYVVSAPVWEYFAADAPPAPQESGAFAWRTGLERELELDKLNGFVGKTAVHPSQLPIIRSALRVTRPDYEDALRVVHWQDTLLGVAKGSGRMNEVNTHKKWAEKTLLLAEIYGIREQKPTEYRECNEENSARLA